MAALIHNLQTLLNYQPLWRAVLFVSAAAIVFLATTSQPYPIPSAASDKVNHLLAFLHLTVVTRLAWPQLGLLWVVASMLGFGLAIEVTQAQLPYREFSLLDLAADGGGVAMGLVLFPFLKPAEKRI